ncbi:DNA replication protein [Haloferax larsenii]|uniref:DNA replication protein n=1 Tax=Haloferax larsenii TaxID=302484 RepID=A0ABY5RDF6_HALLR|nr:DNA replication protein [Haloferax larsenii]UVE50209.1 DNA replication protein [Haloferax larsenii]
MNVDELRSVLRTERQKDSLQQLRESFYEDVSDYIAERKATREQKAEELGTHYSPDIRQITDEIETAEEVVTSIYERRVGKVVKAASFSAAGMSSTTEGLTTEEKRLFEDLVSRIEENRSTVLSSLEDVAAADAPAGGHESAGSHGLAGDHGTGASHDVAADPDTAEAPASDPTIPPDEPDPETADSAPTFDTPSESAGDVLANAMGDGDDADESMEGASESPTMAANSESPTTAASESPAADDDAPRPPSEADAVLGDDGANVADGDSDADPTTPPKAEADDDPLAGLVDDRETVRITADVGTILGIDDREYDLAREDVVTLPAANADPLVERGAAEKLE